MVGQLDLHTMLRWGINMSQKYILFINDILAARYDSAVNKVIPTEALPVSDELFTQTIEENDGTWELINGAVEKVPFPPPTREQLDSYARTEREARLIKMDQTLSNPLRWASFPDDLKGEWATYRQALLDVPLQPDYPYNYTWPTEPNV